MLENNEQPEHSASQRVDIWSRTIVALLIGVLIGAVFALMGPSALEEHIASLINTLALAYVGSSLPLLLLFTVNADFPLWVTLNSEFMAEEIIRTLVGSATLLIAVPISTSLAAHFMRGAPEEHGGHGHHHGHVHHHHE